jgi:hypothetical protein
MDMNLDHLSESARAVALLLDKERIRDIESPRWIGYSRAKQILDRMEMRLAHPPTHRMPNLLLMGETNNGKTAILNRFVKDHDRVENRRGDYAHLPVLMVQAPPGPDEARLYQAILLEMHSPPIQERADRLQFRVIRLLKQVGLRMLIIDEIHHVLSGPSAKQRYFLNVIKYLGNELQIPIVAAGIEAAYHAIQNDPQLANRFHPVTLPAWRQDTEFLRLLKTFEMVLPLRRPSNLSEPKLSTKLLEMTEGTIGELAMLLEMAATLAIQTGAEAISQELLKEVDYVPPSKRKWGPREPE